MRADRRDEFRAERVAAEVERRVLLPEGAQVAVRATCFGRLLEACVEIVNQGEEDRLLFGASLRAYGVEQQRQGVARAKMAVVEQAAHAGNREVACGTGLRERAINIRILAAEGKREPGVAALFRHKGGQQIGCALQNVHVLYWPCSTGHR